MPSPPNTPPRVLVLGDDTRSFLATVRGLGRRGITVHAAPANMRAPALRSRYIHAVHRLPPWCGDGADWLDGMEALIRREDFTVLVPCNETALLPLQRHRARFEALTRLAMPHDEAVAVLFDKHATRALAQRLRIPVAQGRLLREDDTAAELAAELGTPLLLKPRFSYTLDSLHQRGRVRVAHDRVALAACLARPAHGGTLAEGFVPGRGVGLSVLAHDGEVLQTFQHARDREREGVSFYRRSVAPEPPLAAACMAMVAALNFTGVAMFEFRRDGAGGWTLLEVNARPWGSMPLPLALGVEFAYRWFLLISAGQRSPAVTYRPDLYARNLIPDLRAVLAQAGERTGIAARAAFLAQQTWTLRRLLTGEESLDVLVADDPRPAWAEVRDLLAEAVVRIRANLPGHTMREAARARRAVRQAWARPGAIIFVCQGNICRSPWAAAVLARMLPGCGRIRSAGMLPLPGRVPPPLALRAAAALGMDISAHRSSMLTQAEAEAASLLVVFDAINRAALLDQFPQLAPRLLRLGDLTGVGDIADPVDGDAAVFSGTYRVIRDAVAAFRQEVVL